jgi:hypothetical protein
MDDMPHNDAAQGGDVNTGNATAPAYIMPDHWRMLTVDSGIDPAVIAERGYRSIAGADGYSELKRRGFKPGRRQNCDGLLLPLHTTDGQSPVIVFRPDHPDLDTRGRARKYLFPPNQGMRIDCPPRCREALGNPAVPLFITEGQKKADKLASEGACAIDLLGVWNFLIPSDFVVHSFRPPMEEAMSRLWSQLG